MKRIVTAVMSVNLLIGALGLLYIWWRSRDPSVVALSALGTTTDAALAEMLRADAAGAAMTWWALVILGAAICAAVWLMLAWRKQPATPQQARSGGLSWWLLLAAVLAIALAAGYRVYVNDAVAQAWRTTLILGGMLVLPVAYFLSTALGVKGAMAPSVPLATLIRR